MIRSKQASTARGPRLAFLVLSLLAQCISAGTVVDMDSRRQKITGFGGSEGFIIMEAAFMQMPKTTQSECLGLAFRDLGATVLRIPLESVEQARAEVLRCRRNSIRRPTFAHRAEVPMRPRAPRGCPRPAA